MPFDTDDPYRPLPPPPPRRGASRSTGARGARSGARRAPGHAPGPLPTTRTPRRRVSRARYWWRRALVLSVIFGMLVGAGVIAEYIYIGTLFHRTHVNHLQDATSTSENILLVGSTSRCALKHQNKAYGICSTDNSGVNSDIVMVVHLDPATHQVSLLSIPRDLFVPNARTYGANKIDAALFQGPSQLAAAIEEDFGIPINHFVELNFDTFASVVDDLGGIYMYFPIPVYDKESGLNIKQAGCYHLDGFHALQVVRARHLQHQTVKGDMVHQTWPQEAQSDIARIRRTHEFLRVLAEEVASRGIGNPITDQSILTTVLPSLKVDQNFGENHMISLAETFAGTHITNVPQFTYPVVTVEVGSYEYKGYYYGDIEFPIQPGGVTAVDTLFQTGANQNVFTGAKLPAPKSIKVSVLNGSGVAGQAATIATGLTHRGFVVTHTGNAAPNDPTENETVVWYAGPPPPKNTAWHSPWLAAAQKVMHQLQGPAIMGYNPAMVTPGAAVTIQTGTDLTLAAPPVVVHHKKHHHKGHHTTTTTTAPTTNTTVIDPPGVKTDNHLGAPTALAQTLQPWDPRSCNPAHTGPGSY